MPQVEANAEAEAGHVARAAGGTSWWKKSPVAPTALLSWPRLGNALGRKRGRSMLPFPTKSLSGCHRGSGLLGFPGLTGGQKEAREG